MAMATQPRSEAPHRIDGVGGVRCKGCDAPFFKVASSPDGKRPSGVIFLRHKSCGYYNIVDLSQLAYS